VEFHRGLHRPGVAVALSGGTEPQRIMLWK